MCVSFLQYYALDITYFKSSLDSHLLDLLWNKYWVNTLSSSPLLGNGDYVAGQISDLGTCIVMILVESIVLFYYHCEGIYCAYVSYAAEKLEQAENQLAHSRFGPLIAPPQRKKEVSIFFWLYVYTHTQIHVELFKFHLVFF